MSAAPSFPTAASPAGSDGILPGSPSGPYAVILVAANDVLNIRSGPGAENSVVGSFQPIFTAVMRTGPSSKAGEALWVEVQNPAGGKGWVNAKYLIEFVSPSAFCSDSQVTSILQILKTAIVTSNGELFASLVSPVHGLDVRKFRDGRVVNYDGEHAEFVFVTTFEVNWGPAPGSGQDTIGTFSEVPFPNLLDVLTASYERHCNDALDLATFSLEPWLSEYANVNFYNLYKPGTETYDGLDWRTWLVGIECVQGQPYLFTLIHFQWEP